MGILWTAGPLIWKLLLAAWTVGAGAALLRLRRRWIAGTRRDAHALRVLRVRPLVEGVTHLRGTLRSSEGGQIRWLECDGTRVELIGPLVGVEGADADVIAEGSVARRGARWTLGPGARTMDAGPGRPRGPAVAVHAARLPPVPRARARTVLVTGMIACGTGLGMTYELGAYALDHHESGRPEVHTVTWCAVAAALPWSRAAALQDLSAALGRTNGYSPELVQDRLAVADLRQDCKTRVEIERSGNQLAEGVRDALSCGRDVDAGELQARLGDFAAIEPAALASAPDLAGVRAIAEGDWRQAADAADRMSRASQRGPIDQERYRCLGHLFRKLAGDDVSRALAQDARDRRNLDCVLVAALASASDDRVAALALVAVAPLGGEAGAVARTLLDFEDDRVTSAAEDRPGIDSPGVDDRTLAWFGRWPPAVAVTGERARRVQRVQAAFARYRADYDPRGPLGTAWQMPGRGPGDRPLQVSPEACTDRVTAAYASAAAGDGGPLAAVFHDCDVEELDGEALANVLPMVHRNREALAMALRTWNAEPAGWVDTTSTMAFVAEALDRRDLARLVGDEAGAARWQAIIARHAAVFADRDRLIAMLLWQER